MRSSRIRSTASYFTEPQPSPSKSLDNTNHCELVRERKTEYQLSHQFMKLSKAQKYKINFQLFPYKRGCHYFQDLVQFPRINDTSYVKNINLKGTFHDDKLKQTYQTENLINRDYFGLPLPVSKDKKYKDKNQCHQFLFKNQDKKWKLDQTLYELKYILKHPKILQENSAVNYRSVKKDFELSVLYDKQEDLEEKISVLERKIQSLESRKKKLFEEIEEQDEMFYQPSLNQQFFHMKEEQDKMINVQQIILEAVCMSELNELIYSKIEPNSVEQSKLKILFSIFTTTEKDMPTFQQQFQKYMKSGKAKEKIVPSFILHFENKNTLNWVSQVLLMRIYQSHGECGFYALKNIWSKLFDQDLVFNDEQTNIDSEEYIEAMRMAYIKLKHKPKKGMLFPKAIQLPKAQRHKLYFQQQKKPTKLSAKQYVVLYLVYYLYERVGLLNLDYRLVGSQLFNKYQYKIIQKLGDKSVASFNSVIKKCCNVITESVIEADIPIELYSEYNYECQTLMVWTKEKQEVQSEGSELNESLEESQDDAALEVEGDSFSYFSESLEFPTKRKRLV